MPLNKQELMEAIIIRFFSRPPEAMYDIGVGPKSEWKTLQSFYPQLVVCGCEPLADLYPTLQDFPGRLEKVAIGSGNHCEIHFNRSSLLCACMMNKKPNDETRTVPVWTLDKFDEHMGKLNNIILWMDIEGMELEALKTGENLLSSGRVKWINLEERIKETSQWAKGANIAEFLERFGYVRTLEYNRHTSHQDVIYAHNSVLNKEEKNG